MNKLINLKKERERCGQLTKTERKEGRETGGERERERSQKLPDSSCNPQEMGRINIPTSWPPPVSCHGSPLSKPNWKPEGREFNEAVSAVSPPRHSRKREGA